MERISTDDCTGRHLLTGFGILLHDPIALFPLEDLNPNGFIIKDAHPIGSKIDVTCLRVLQDHEYSGAKISASVQFIESGRWKCECIDLIPFEDIFEDGTVFLFLGPNDLLDGDIHPFLSKLNHG